MESKFQQRELKKAVTDQPNLTGIPTQMKLNFEQRSGMSFDDVRVHYNSDKPAQLRALAYTQGTQIYVGPGQERSLPHELGHVIQQKAGLVRANAMHPSGVAMNTEEALERQADEIGAGRRIEVSPANNASTDIVQRYIMVNNCIFAQAPGPDEKRKVMVKDGEPASVYFEQSVSESIKPLERLGIVQIEDKFTPYHDSNNLEIGKFVRFGQSQIPVTRSARDQKPIPQPLRETNELYAAKNLLGLQAGIIQELYFLVNILWRFSLSPELENIYKNTNAKNIVAKMVKAYCDYEKPDNLVAMHALGQDITLDIFAMQSIAKQLSDSPTVNLVPIQNEYDQLRAENTNKPIAVEQKSDESLAKNTTVTSQDEASFVLRIAEEFLNKMQTWQENGGIKAIAKWIDPFIDSFKKQSRPETLSIIQSINHFCDVVKGRIDLILALEIVKEDLEFRMKQVEEECKREVCKFVPLMPTGCDESARCRGYLSSLLLSGVNFKDENFGKRPDGTPLIHWPFHYATPVPLPGLIGENDFLFIEDAVGKAYRGSECANAHWVAHIYGRREEQNSGPQEGAVEPKNETADEFKKLDCRFNDLSQALRCKFLQEANINDKSVYELTYYEGLSATIFEEDKKKEGKLEIVVKDNMMMYKFSSKTPMQYKQYMKHFILDVAKTVLDEFVLQAFVLRDEEVQKDLKSINAIFYKIEIDPRDPMSPDYAIERLYLPKAIPHKVSKSDKDMVK